MLTLTTPALLFPAISLLLLAYTNRFLAIAGLIRKLHQDYKNNHSENVLGQIKNLRLRLRLIRDMQVCGVSGLLLCVVSMFLIYAAQVQIAEYIFGLSLILLMVSLAFSVYEVQISTGALKIRLGDLEEQQEKKQD